MVNPEVHPRHHLHPLLDQVDELKKRPPPLGGGLKGLSPHAGETGRHAQGPGMGLPMGSTFVIISGL